MRRDETIAVIGGGPAGLAAAEALAGSGLAVTVYERMPSVGRKLLIAGRGGLNLTHSEPLAHLLSRYRPDHAALRAAVADFPPQALRAWSEGLGQPTFVGSSGRVFPESFKASPLLRAWLARLTDLGVGIRTRHRLIDWDGRSLSLEGPDGTIEIRPRAGLLALGGASWPRLGTDGSWVPLLRSRNVAIAPLQPSNVGFSVDWSTHFSTRFAGQPLKRVGLRLGGRQVRGEAMITATGIEGGAIYALSSDIREAILTDGAATLVVDLRPDLDTDSLARRLSDPKSGSSMASRLRKDAGLGPVSAGLLREAHGLDLPRDGKALALRIKEAPLSLSKPGAIDRAISTAGGIAFEELDARFMLRAHPGTFVAGEMLDWEAPTGGYLLQAAFATGRAAAAGLSAWLAETAD